MTTWASTIGIQSSGTWITSTLLEGWPSIDYQEEDTLQTNEVRSFKRRLFRRYSTKMSNLFKNIVFGYSLFAKYIKSTKKYRYL